LILGAGGHGKVCGEIAVECGYEIACLDDNALGKIGKLDCYLEKRKECDSAFVVIGNPELREMWTKFLKKAEYKVVSIISTKTVISPSTDIVEGCVIMAGTFVQSNCVIGQGCILGTGAIIDHDSQVGDYAHIIAGTIVPSVSLVKDKTKINYGEVWKNV